LFKQYLPFAATRQNIALGSLILLMIIVLMNVGIAAGTFFKQWQISAEAKATAENEKRKTELELTQTKQRQAEIEMRALRAQMNPHFIFNSLNSINKYILKSDHANASRYLTRFAKLIRLILDNSNSREVALSDELEALKLYIEMESLRFTSKFEYEIIVATDISADTLQVPPLIMQPYVENAIWHGLLHKEAGGRLLVTIEKIKEDMLQCTIEDNGIGRKRASELKSKSATNNKSLGMKLTEERIVMLNQYTSQHASISIIDLENEKGEATGTKVILKIPV
jgi:sensor histidine kinase YesM